jgi:hypothetical protein
MRTGTISAISVVLISLLLGPLLTNASNVLATDRGASGLETILNQSKAIAEQKISDLQNVGISIPDQANSQYLQGLTEYQAALNALNGDIANAKIHAFKAMNLFKNTIELIQQPQNTTSNDANETSILLQNIADSESYAEKIRVLFKANGLSVSTTFADYNKAIDASKAFVANGNFVAANEQLSIAQDLLDKIYLQLENQAESNKDARANQFLKVAVTTLTQMIVNAKNLGLSQSTIDTIQNTLDKLQNAKTTTEIIDNTGQTSNLQNVTDQYNSQLIANFEKESLKIQHDVNVLQDMANKMNLHLTGFGQINQLLDDIKQKIANGQTDEATQELDQENSLLANMNDVVNGVTPIIHDINQARDLGTSLQAQAQAQNDDISLGNIGQAIQLLDSANSIVLDATSSSDLQSAKDTISQAQGLLNNVKDTLNNTSQTKNNQTTNFNSTTSSSSTDNSTTSSNSTG